MTWYPPRDWDLYGDGVSGDQPSIIYTWCPYGCRAVNAILPESLVRKTPCRGCGRDIPHDLVIPADRAWAPEWLAHQHQLYRVWQKEVERR